jgi:DNA recombination protein RmuC
VTEILLIAVLVLLAINVLLLFLSLRKGKKGAPRELEEIKSSISYFDKSLRDEFARNREETGRNSREAREELSNSFKTFGDPFLKQLESFSSRLDTLTKSNIEQLEKVRETVELKLQRIQDDTSQKLEKMRETVDEKLHKTLDERLGESFRLVSERLDLVHKGLGEMQSLAVGVGDLKKVLSNVKTRGIHGEIQLGNILEQILTSEQYERNVSTKKGSRDNVEFAIRLPGRDDSGEAVYLPLDSKFPAEIYQSLVEAYEHGNPEEVEARGKLLESSIKKFAKDIRDKYIDPPHTTDFGIMFLPYEGLYAEVLRRTGLFESLQKDYKISITGPTTLAAFLNSLQMGFRTLAIEKQSSEVWKILGAVKTEFDRFGDTLKQTQEKLGRASDDLDKLVGTRTRQIQRTLRKVQELPARDAGLLLNIDDEAE